MWSLPWRSDTAWEGTESLSLRFKLRCATEAGDANRERNKDRIDKRFHPNPDPCPDLVPNPIHDLVSWERDRSRLTPPQTPLRYGAGSGTSIEKETPTKIQNHKSKIQNVSWEFGRKRGIDGKKRFSRLHFLPSGSFYRSCFAPSPGFMATKMAVGAEAARFG